MVSWTAYGVGGGGVKQLPQQVRLPHMCCPPLLTARSRDSCEALAQPRDVKQFFVAPYGMYLACCVAV